MSAIFHRNYSEIPQPSSISKIPHTTPSIGLILSRWRWSHHDGEFINVILNTSPFADINVQDPNVSEPYSFVELVACWCRFQIGFNVIFVGDVEAVLYK